MEQLKSLIIKKIGRTLEAPADFEYLSEQIRASIGDYISATTLKRVFGYIPQTHTLRPYTLSILARYVGYAGWQDYKNKQQSESVFISSTQVKTSDLQKGNKIIISWLPNRKCMLEYLGCNKFVVLYNENSKLQIGDTFCTLQFVKGLPLTATQYCSLRSNNSADTYIAGAKKGLTSIELLHV